MSPGWMSVSLGGACVDLNLSDSARRHPALTHNARPRHSLICNDDAHRPLQHGNSHTMHSGRLWVDDRVSKRGVFNI